MGAAVALDDVLLQTLQANRFQVAGHVRLEARRGHGLLVRHLLDRLENGGGLKGRPAGQQFVENGPQRINIGQRTDLLHLAAGLLGRHVVRRAHQRSAFGVTGVFRQSLCQAKVGDLRNAIDREEDVGGLQVPVDDAVVMGVLHGLGQGLDQVGGIARRLGFAVDLGIQAAPAHEFQGEIRQTLVLTFFVDLNDIRMLQVGDSLGLGEKALQLMVAGVGGGQDHFQGQAGTVRRFASRWRLRNVLHRGCRVGGGRVVFFRTDRIDRGQAFWCRRIRLLIDGASLPNCIGRGPLTKCLMNFGQFALKHGALGLWDARQKWIDAGRFSAALATPTGSWSVSHGEHPRRRPEKKAQSQSKATDGMPSSRPWGQDEPFRRLCQTALSQIRAPTIPLSIAWVASSSGFQSRQSECLGPSR